MHYDAFCFPITSSLSVILFTLLCVIRVLYSLSQRSLLHSQTFLQCCTFLLEVFSESVAIFHVQFQKLIEMSVTSGVKVTLSVPELLKDKMTWPCLDSSCPDQQFSVSVRAYWSNCAVN